jgi:hypothetical protein
MSRDHLKLWPHNINENWWWYEEPQGICVVHHQGTKGAAMVNISWRSLRAALKRLDKKK